ncbi:MAG: aminotransferase class IV [Reichenbachiella sp.]|uniref:aminotransferase class IV n=1 Tax=Reichenbachiella sp. TaxID=2184521 RepID=UPI0029671B7B|nr:aminotransferase class IV [Reichenbachiella sp.]MDW3210135.1 aminotransferase class IV [Reichenbachiella sp.]
MSQFIESICCIDGELQLLELHQARVNRTFFTNYGLLAKPIRLNRVIKQIPSKGKFKCRVEYDNEKVEVNFTPYQTPKISSLAIVEGGDVDYRFKYADRKALDHLYAQRNGKDDVLIVKDGLISDSYFANVAFFDGEEWWTPEEPLLAGVQRQYLLDQRLIQTTKIRTSDINKYEKISMINAMIDLEEIEIAATDIS